MKNPTRVPQPLVGMLRLARFRADGMAEFGSTVPMFLNSLVPLIAFPLVGAAMLLMRGQVIVSVTGLVATLVALLAPAVLSWMLAVRWQREADWLRYTVAFNWCQWVVPAAFMIGLLLIEALIGLGLSEDAAFQAATLAAGAYGLCLHWFLARHGLRLGKWRAVVMVAVSDLGTGLLVVGPMVITIAVNGTPNG